MLGYDEPSEVEADAGPVPVIAFGPRLVAESDAIHTLYAAPGVELHEPTALYCYTSEQ